MNKFTFICLITFLFSSCFSERSKLITGLEGKPLPEFNLLMTDSTSKINTTKIPSGQPFVLIYFSPFCPYCRAQTEELKDNIQSFGKTTFYFISEYNLQQIRSFESEYGLNKFKNFKTAKLTDTSFVKYYQVKGVPYIAVYDANKNLKEAFLGKVSISDLKQAALEKIN